MRCVSCRAELEELAEEDNEVPEVTRFARFSLFDTHCKVEGFPFDRCGASIYNSSIYISFSSGGCR